MLSKENRLIEKKTVTFFCARFFIKEKGGKEKKSMDNLDKIDARTN